ncbi:MAG TPA: hypothetical protein VFA44_12995 [Gaiellaceae bacterium]|nr:hypothetical protein [Gaiellaceae bacterium]
MLPLELELARCVRRRRSGRTKSLLHLDGKPLDRLRIGPSLLRRRNE